MDQQQIATMLQALMGNGGNVNGNDNQDNQRRGIATDYMVSIHNAVVCPTKLADNSLVSGLFYRTPRKNNPSEVISKLVVTLWNNSAFPNTPSSTFKATFWGKYAEIFARCLSMGQFVDLEMTTQHTYFDNPNQMENATVNGQAIQRPKRVYYEENRVTKCYLRDESAKTVGNEIANWPTPVQIAEAGGNWRTAIGGKLFKCRPVGFNHIGSPDEAIWKEIKTMRNQTTYVPGNQLFGYCAVIDKTGAVSAYSGGNANAQPGAVNPDLMTQLMAQIQAMGGNTSRPVTITNVPPVTTQPATPAIDPAMQALIAQVAASQAAAGTGGGSLNI